MLEVKERFSDMAKAIKEKKPELAEYLGLQVLADCNIYAREMTRTMINTSSCEVDSDGTAILSWNTPYAERVYWTGVARTEENPHATTRWCEVARDRHGKDWFELFKKALETKVLS